MTSTGPTARSVTRSARGPVAFAVVAVLVLTVVTLAVGTRRTGALDPRAYDPAGTRALAQLLQDRGAPVEVIGAADEIGTATNTVVVLPFPEAMDPDDLAAAAASRGRLLVVAPGQDSIDALGLDLTVRAGLPQQTLDPECSLDVAVRAGDARVGGTGFEGGGCYRLAGVATVVRSGQVTVVGSGDFLTNGRLDEDGNAALALGLLEPADRVLWLLPAAGSGDGERGLLSLLPSWFTAALLQLGVAVAVLALWRARRLGRVVVEPLPVVVRAAEAVEGRGRLYRTAKARDRAADALRSASRDAASRRLSLGVSVEPAALVAAAAARTGRPAAELEALLYGPVPADDAALVRLADALSRFDSEVS